MTTSPSAEHSPRAPLLLPSSQNTFPILNLIAPPLPPPAPPSRPQPHTYPHLTQSDIALSQKAYTELLNNAKTYRLALATLSSAASSFGTSLEDCARLKEARSPPLYTPSTSYATHEPCSADPILTASGIHHLLSNHQQILSETVYRTLEVPLLEGLDDWRRQIEEEDVAYQREARLRARGIRKAEAEGAKLRGPKNKKWDVTGLRSHLVGLTGKLDAFTALHRDHAQTLLRESQDLSNKVVDCTSSLVRAELEIFEGLARKGWAGGGLEELLERGQDPFAAADDGQVGEHLNGMNAGYGVMSIDNQSFEIPRGGEQKASAAVDDQSPVGDKADYVEPSIFCGHDTEQTLHAFSPSPSLQPMQERHPSVWDPETPVSEAPEVQGDYTVSQNHEDMVHKEVGYERDEGVITGHPWNGA